MKNQDVTYLTKAINEARKGIKLKKGGPFGAMVVLHGKIISKASNMVLSTNDPTAHAEIVAIRKACKKLNSYQLDDCVLYASCEPCPMCLGAIYWARPSRVVFGASRMDAAQAGFDDSLIYTEVVKPINQRLIPFTKIELDISLQPFLDWEKWGDKMLY